MVLEFKTGFAKLGDRKKQEAVQKGYMEVMHFGIICSRNDRMEEDWLMSSSGKRV